MPESRKSRAKQLADRMPSEHDTLSARYVGNGSYHVPPEILLHWIQEEVKAAPTREAKRGVFYQDQWLPVIHDIRQRDEVSYLQLVDDAKSVGAWQLETIMGRIHAASRVHDYPDPQTLSALMAKDLPPPNYLVNPILRDGITLFAGKSKRGKSWLMLDIAMAVAFGNKAFRHYDTVQHPVLYLALEDGERRIKRRIDSIYPGVKVNDKFQYYVNFPSLDENFLEILEGKIDKFSFQLVVVDVLAKILPRQKGSGRKNEYQDIYELFAPLQKISKERNIGVVFLDHLRKSESSEDKFEDIMGTTAKQGVADVLWVLERKPKDSMAFLHVRDKDLEDMTIGLEFKDGHWEYLGEGEEFEYDREQQLIIKILHEEGREMSVQDIMKAAGWVGEARYARLRKVLMRMAKEDLIHRARHGKYAATISSSIHYVKDDEEIPF